MPSLTQQKERERAAGRAWTPGPWSVDRRNGGQEFVSACDFQIALLCDGDARQRDANARLIAAAPDLYEALQRISELCDDDNGAHFLTRNDTTRALCRAALSRVEVEHG